MKIIKLKRGKEIPFIHHHPWIFSGAIENENKTKAIDGEEIKVLDYQEQFIGWGLYNSKSQIRVRLYSFSETEMLDTAFFNKLISNAINMRKQTLSQEAFQNACRLIFSEADNLSGLVVDKFEEYLSLQFTSLAMYLRKDALVTQLIKELKPKAIFLRTEKGIAEEEGLEIKDDLIYGEKPTQAIKIKENGLDFEINIETGQKTGFYVDQRDNRYSVRKYAEGKSCLDVCSYSGGFSLNLLKAGADFVKAIDVSENALTLARRNAELNKFTNIEFIKSDAFKFLENEIKDFRKYDLIVLDPPKFTHSRAQSNQALKGYTQLNSLAMKCLNANGILVTCSCSGRISRDDFFTALAQAALISNRKIRLLEQRGAASDHPVNPECPESAYLKCNIYWVE